MRRMKGEKDKKDEYMMKWREEWDKRAGWEGREQ